MLKRNAIDDLIKWKEEETKKPILITGAKGVGKSFLAYDFGKTFYKHICYLNFERDQRLQDLLHRNDFTKVKERIQEEFITISELNNEDDLLILDEVQITNTLIAWVDEINHSISQLKIILISNQPVLEGIDSNFYQLMIYPMEFDEFLRAINHEWYIELIINHYKSNTKIPDIVHKELLELHQLYLKIGGMPGALNEYLNLTTVVNIPKQHEFLMGSYHSCIEKYFGDDGFKMKQVYDSLPTQLRKDNKKFQYKFIRKGTTHSMYKEAIKKLAKLYYVIRCDRITTGQLIDFCYSNYDDDIFDDVGSHFKLYYNDTGLLYSMIEEGSTEDNKHRLLKTILENYVAQSLYTKQYSFGFWESDSMAKIDFIVNKNNMLLPIEVFQDDNTRSKSISILKQKAPFDYAIKISTKNFEFTNNIKYVPPYAVFCI